MDMFFWKCAGIRALKTFCQTLLSVCTVQQELGVVDWKEVVYVSAGAAVLSIATSFAGLPEVEARKEIDL